MSFYVRYETLFKLSSGLGRAVSLLRCLVTVLLPRRTGFKPGTIDVGFVADKMALGQVSPRVLGYLLSVSFQKCPTPIFIYMLFLPEGQMGEAWKPCRKQCPFENRDWLEKYFGFLQASKPYIISVTQIQVGPFKNS